MSELRDSGRTNFNVPSLADVSGRPRDAYLEAVREAGSSEYEVYGEIGRGEAGTIVYLARDLVDKNLVILRLTPGGVGDDFFLEVVKQLDASVPAPESFCASCGSPLRQWGRYCTMCGSDLWRDPSLSGEQSREELLEAVKDVAAGNYEILGEIPNAEGGGYVYFGRNIATGKVSALRLLKESEGEYSLGRTGVLKRLAKDVSPQKPAPPPQAPTPKSKTPEPFPLGSPPPQPSPLDAFPSTPQRPRPSQPPPYHRQAYRSSHADQWEQILEFVRQPLVLAIIIAVLAIVLTSLCWIAVAPGEERGESAGAEVSSAPSQPALDEIVLGYSVAIASYRTLDEAIDHLQELEANRAQFYVVPTTVRGALYYRLFAGMLPDEAAAEALMTALVEAGVKDVAREWDVRPTRLAFFLGSYRSQREADAAVAALLRGDIPAYTLPGASDGRSALHVYAGGYENSREAAHLEELLGRAGEVAVLGERVGLSPE